MKVSCTTSSALARSGQNGSTYPCRARAWREYSWRMTASGSPPSPSGEASVVAAMSTNTDSKMAAFTDRRNCPAKFPTAGYLGAWPEKPRERTQRRLNRRVVLCVIVDNDGRVVGIVMFGSEDATFR